MHIQILTSRLFSFVVVVESSYIVGQAGTAVDLKRVCFASLFHDRITETASNSMCVFIYTYTCARFSFFYPESTIINHLSGSNVIVTWNRRYSHKIRQLQHIKEQNTYPKGNIWCAGQVVFNLCLKYRPRATYSSGRCNNTSHHYLKCIHAATGCDGILLRGVTEYLKYSQMGIVNDKKRRHGLLTV